MTNRRSAPATRTRQPVWPASARADRARQPGARSGLLIRCLLLASLLAIGPLMGGCGDKPPCDVFVERMCAAVGSPGCDRLKDTPPTDADACAAVLADDAELTRQVDALKAAAIAIERAPSEPAKAPTGDE